MIGDGRGADAIADAGGPDAIGHPSRARRAVGPTVVALLPNALAALAEGAWVAVVAALVAAAAHDPSRLGVAGFAVVAVVGLVAARRWGADQRWPALLVGLTAAAGAAGWLFDPGTAGALARLDVGDAVAHHPAGWLAAVAFLRGSAHARPVSSRGAMESLLSVALPGLTVPILLGGVLPSPWRDDFLADARLGVVVFLVSATVGVAVARLAALRGTAGFDWRGNRAWLLLLVVLVLGVSLSALPLAAVVGPTVQLLVAVLFLPVLVLGTIAGIRRVSRWAAAAYVVVWLALVAALRLAVQVPLPSQGDQGAPRAVPETPSDSTFVGVGLAILVLAFLVGVVLVLARLWARDVLARGASDVPEERWIESERADDPRGRPRRARPRRRRPVPTTAADAYLALVGDLVNRPAVRREPVETPAAHAERLRRSGRGSIALDLLAADYELARFGGIPVSPAEDRRAIGRWRRLRTSLRG